MWRRANNGGVAVVTRSDHTVAAKVSCVLRTAYCVLTTVLSVGLSQVYTVATISEVR